IITSALPAETVIVPEAPIELVVEQTVLEVTQVPGVGPVGPQGQPGHSFLPMSFPGTLTVAVGQIPITATRDTTIFGAWASCAADSEPTGADAIFDIRIEG